DGAGLAACCGNRFDDLIGSVGAGVVVHDDCCTTFRQFKRDSPSDATASTCYHGNAIRQLCHERNISWGSGYKLGMITGSRARAKHFKASRDEPKEMLCRGKSLVSEDGSYSRLSIGHFFGSERINDATV